MISFTDEKESFTFRPKLSAQARVLFLLSSGEEKSLLFLLFSFFLLKYMGSLGRTQQIVELLPNHFTRTFTCTSTCYNKKRMPPKKAVVAEKPRLGKVSNNLCIGE